MKLLASLLRIYPLKIRGLFVVSFSFGFIVNLASLSSFSSSRPNSLSYRISVSLICILIIPNSLDTFVINKYRSYIDVIILSFLQ
jgi:hypothetical protein